MAAVAAVRTAAASVGRGRKLPAKSESAPQPRKFRLPLEPGELPAPTCSLATPGGVANHFAGWKGAEMPEDAVTHPGDTKKRLLTGDRPTGKLHLGHYVG